MDVHLGVGEPATVPRAGEPPVQQDDGPESAAWPLRGRSPGRLSVMALDPVAWPGASTRRLSVKVLHVPPGRLQPSAIGADPETWLGLLVIDGLLFVELAAERGRVGCLLGSDDLLRPWDLLEASLTVTACWRALLPTRIGLLDDDFARRAGGIPSITRSLVGRSAQTTRWLLAKALIISVPVIEQRLVLLFALLAERWGRVRSDGVCIDLPLTHQVLASLVGARRPSVSTALSSLAADGLLARRPDGGWLLRRAGATEHVRRPVCWNSFAGALGMADLPARRG